VATRVDGSLYYLHADPAHTMLSVSDAQGTDQGHLWYDPHGSVLTSTLPITLTEQLLSSQGLDSRLGLVYHGDGRWYDPALAHTLQPDPFGGVLQLWGLIPTCSLLRDACVASSDGCCVVPLLCK
jgi:hypothetical protein